MNVKQNCLEINNSTARIYIRRYSTLSRIKYNNLHKQIIKEIKSYIYIMPALATIVVPTLGTNVVPTLGTNVMPALATIVVPMLCQR